MRITLLVIFVSASSFSLDALMLLPYLVKRKDIASPLYLLWVYGWKYYYVKWIVPNVLKAASTIYRTSEICEVHASVPRQSLIL